jgi:hypothetical protein
MSATIVLNPGLVDGYGNYLSTVYDNGTDTLRLITQSYTSQLPSGLVNGRLDINFGSWLGSTLPTIGQKAMTDSIPVVIANDQSVLSIAMAYGYSSTKPDYNNIKGVLGCLVKDVDNRLECHSAVVSDEGSFRDDFSGSSLITTLTGTLTFTNNSTNVTGSGTIFTTEVAIGQYLKKSADSETYYARVSEIISDTQLTLSTLYVGTTASTTAVVNNWKTITPSGGSIVVSTSNATLSTGTTNGSFGSITRLGDYLPYTLQIYASVSQRIVNQTLYFGFYNSSTYKQAIVKFTGTTNTQVSFVTSFSSASTDTQTTTVTLPGGATTASTNLYKIDVSANQVTLSINGVVVASNSIHIPGPYDEMDIVSYVANTSTGCSTTSLVIDYIYFANWDRIQIDSDFSGEALTTREIKSGISTVTSIGAAVSDTSLLIANPSRLMAAIFNDSIANLYLKLGTGASTTSFTILIARNGYYEIPYGYSGAINGYWSTATGYARITELT